MRFGISLEYQTELQVVIHALGRMKQPASAVHWDRRGTAGVGVLVSDTLMFQRRAAGIRSGAGAILRIGVAADRSRRAGGSGAVGRCRACPAFSSNYKMLLLTYDGQKPPRAGIACGPGGLGKSGRYAGRGR